MVRGLVFSSQEMVDWLHYWTRLVSDALPTGRDGTRNCAVEEEVETGFNIHRTVGYV
jgi:hypothetical protein